LRATRDRQPAACFHFYNRLRAKEKTMPRYNRVTLVGNLVRDPEIRYVAGGNAVTNFTLAVNRKSKEADSVDYIDIVAWDKLAETSNTYLKKGTLVLVEGRLAIRPYESKGGEKHKAAEVVISLLQMLSRAKINDTPSNAEPQDLSRAL
jgi:single-strand DNA-binding protein